MLSSSDHMVDMPSECSTFDSSGHAFTWMQSEEGVDISVRLTSKSVGGSSARSRLVDVDITSFKVTVQGPVDGGSEKTLLLDVRLHAPIRSSESTWSVSGDMLEIYLEKQAEGNMWPQLEK
jgi:hypothetical protein